MASHTSDDIPQGRAEQGPTLQDASASEPQAHALSLLIIRDEIVERRPLPDRGSISIGRSDENDVFLDDPLASRQHAVLRVGDALQIEDVGSANGTRVRGERIAPQVGTELLPGQPVEIGSSMLLVQRSRAGKHHRRVASFGHLEARVEEECAEGASNRFAILHVCIEGPHDVRRAQEVMSAALRRGDLIAVYARGEYEIFLRDADAELADKTARQIEGRLGEDDAPAFAGWSSHPADGLTAQALMAKARARARGEEADDERSQPAVLDDQAMRDLYRVAERVARGVISVMILGETGVGKEVLAEHVHARSRAKSPFVRINCAALSAPLLESELFGYEKGAFTGADEAKPGLLESADGGTVFLDEVGELPPALQAKLLRVLEQKEVLRVGALKPRRVDLRFICATNRDLEAEMQSGSFRRDLYFRLSGVTLTIPPLRERRTEIEPLARMFAARASKELERSTPLVISPRAMELLISHDWPGNVRELRNVIDRASLLTSGDVIEPEHLPTDKLLQSLPSRPIELALSGDSPDERRRIQEAMDRSGGNQTKAAKLLGVSRRTLGLKLGKYGFIRPRKGSGGD
jgi:DNA-binding NtrC family response regulator